MKRIFGITSLILALGASTAAAQTDGELDRRDGSSVTATVGVFAPTGNLGVEYAHALDENFEVSAGAGLGYLVPVALGSDEWQVAPQAAIMPRARVRFGALRLAAGAGLSVGLYEDDPDFGEASDGIDRMTALWANAEGSAQLISRSGWFGRATLGFGYIIAHSKLENTMGREAMVPDFLGAPYLGLGFGRTL
jgi:hypothetical protein